MPLTKTASSADELATIVAGVLILRLPMGYQIQRTEDPGVLRVWAKGQPYLLSVRHDEPPAPTE